MCNQIRNFPKLRKVQDSTESFELASNYQFKVTRQRIQRTTALIINRLLYLQYSEFAVFFFIQETISWLKNYSVFRDSTSPASFKRMKMLLDIIVMLLLSTWVTVECSCEEQDSSWRTPTEGLLPPSPEQVWKFLHKLPFKLQEIGLCSWVWQGVAWAVLQSTFHCTISYALVFGMYVHQGGVILKINFYTLSVVPNGWFFTCRRASETV